MPNPQKAWADAMAKDTEDTPMLFLSLFFFSSYTGLISLLMEHTCCEYLDMSVCLELSLSLTTHLITTQSPLSSA